MRYERFGILPEAGREIDQVGRREALRIVGGRLRGEGLCGTGFLAGDCGLRHRPLFHRKNRLARHAVEQIKKRLLGGLGERLDGTSVDRNIRQHGRARNIEIPKAVVDELVMPFAHAGFNINGHDALAE